MENPNSLALDEYKISKDSMKSVMTQLSTVTASLLALSIAIMNYGASKAAPNAQLLSWYMVLLLLNFMLAYAIYQNIQITALQQHIAFLEKMLGANDIFRWESIIARIWYEGKGLRAKLLNVLIAAPPLILLLMVYVTVAVERGVLSPYLYAPLALNLIYLSALALSAIAVKNEIDRVHAQRSE